MDLITLVLDLCELANLILGLARCTGAGPPGGPTGLSLGDPVGPP